MQLVVAKPGLEGRSLIPMGLESIFLRSEARPNWVEFIWSFRLLLLISQTFVMICKGGRCAVDTYTAGEVVTLAEGRVC